MDEDYTRLAYLQDALFELLPLQSRPVWPGRFYRAIRKACDFAAVWELWAHWCLNDPVYGVYTALAADHAGLELRSLASTAGDTELRARWAEDIARRASDYDQARYPAGMCIASIIRATDNPSTAGDAVAFGALAYSSADDDTQQIGRSLWLEAACDELIRLLGTSPNAS